ncbi:MAG: hypothetical protein A4E56_01822 [Pelotomaculum sp. PtaU1.Bin065]|nr:MAG: hypothetical protein A4E56_01822 [Pelotomaculum sp. PtaU1.Bin065]
MKYDIICISAAEGGKNIDSFREEIIQLWKENLNGLSRERFDWFYKRNPLGSPVTWCAVDNANGAFVGCNSLYPRSILISNKHAVAGIAADFAISRSHRVFGPSLQLQRSITTQVHEKGFEFSLCWPNKSAAGVFTRAGYRCLGEAAVWVKVLRFGKKLETIITNPFLRSVAAFFADLYVGIIEWLGLLGSQGKRENVVSREVHSVFDKLKGLSAFEDLLIFEKDLAYLNWRYVENRTDEYFFYSSFSEKSKQLIGYLVYSIKDMVVTVWDMNARDLASAKTILLDFSRHMRKSGMVSIGMVFLGNERLQNVFKQAVFVRKNTGRYVSIYCDKEQIRERVGRENNWILFEGDLDL